MKTKKLEILRLDHRTFRDQRITAHVALTSRTMGATHFTYAGERDENMEKSIFDVVNRWGGTFEIMYINKIGQYIRNFKGIVVHLTMYGEEHSQAINEIKNVDEDILVILGGAKVPRYVYDLSDFNVAIGWQPHSEVAAVAIFLYDLNGKDVLYQTREGAKISITPDNSKSRRSERFQKS